MGWAWRCTADYYELQVSGEEATGDVSSGSWTNSAAISFSFLCSSFTSFISLRVIQFVYNRSLYPVDHERDIRYLTEGRGRWRLGFARASPLEATQGLTSLTLYVCGRTPFKKGYHARDGKNLQEDQAQEV